MSQFRLAYLDAPRSSLNVRDGGRRPEDGFVVLGLQSIQMTPRHPAPKRPIGAAMISRKPLLRFGAVAMASRRTSRRRG